MTAQETDKKFFFTYKNNMPTMVLAFPKRMYLKAIAKTPNGLKYDAVKDIKDATRFTKEDADKEFVLVDANYDNAEILEDL